MDPSSPLQIAAWILTGLLALFTLDGCLRGPGYAAPAYYSPMIYPTYGAQPAMPALPGGYGQRGVTHCTFIGNMVTCS